MKWRCAIHGLCEKTAFTPFSISLSTQIASAGHKKLLLSTSTSVHCCNALSVKGKVSTVGNCSAPQRRQLLRLATSCWQMKVRQFEPLWNMKNIWQVKQLGMDSKTIVASASNNCGVHTASFAVSKPPTCMLHVAYAGPLSRGCSRQVPHRLKPSKFLFQLQASKHTIV